MAKQRKQTGNAEQLRIALDSAIEENHRLANELIVAEESVRTLAALLSFMVDDWKNGRDLAPLVAEVEDVLRRLQRVN